MLIAYLDESIDAGDGYVVVAGFLGKKSSWVQCIRRWRKELGSRKNLHLKELRGWKSDRNKDLLERLGKIPDSCGLTLIYCSVKVSDYRDLVQGTIVEVGNEGYLMALRMLVVNLMKEVPKGQRLEIICEEQYVYSARREFLLSILASLPEYQDLYGRSVLSKWSSMPKSSHFEPSDYAAYALLQRLRDPSSRRAILCSPILATKKRRELPIEREKVRLMLETMHSELNGFMPTSPQEQRNFKHLLKEMTL